MIFLLLLLWLLSSMLVVNVQAGSWPRSVHTNLTYKDECKSGGECSPSLLSVWTPTTTSLTWISAWVSSVSTALKCGPKIKQPFKTFKKWPLGTEGWTSPESGALFLASANPPQQGQGRSLRLMMTTLAGRSRAASEGRTEHPVTEQEMVDFRRELCRRGVRVQMVSDSRTPAEGMLPAHRDQCPGCSESWCCCLGSTTLLRTLLQRCAQHSLHEITSFAYFSWFSGN